jgi:hypothetical protein
LDSEVWFVATKQRTHNQTSRMPRDLSENQPLILGRCPYSPATWLNQL